MEKIYAPVMAILCLIFVATILFVFIYAHELGHYLAGMILNLDPEMTLDFSNAEFYVSIIYSQNLFDRFLMAFSGGGLGAIVFSLMACGVSKLKMKDSDLFGMMFIILAVLQLATGIYEIAINNILLLS